MMTLVTIMHPENIRPSSLRDQVDIFYVFALVLCTVNEQERMKRRMKNWK